MKNALPPEGTELDEASREIRRLLDQTEKRDIILSLVNTAEPLSSVESLHAEELRSISPQADHILFEFVKNFNSELDRRAALEGNPLFNSIALAKLDQQRDLLSSFEKSVSNQLDLGLSNIVQQLAANAKLETRTLNIPSSPPDFVQRPEIYNQIHELLISDTAVITALEGSGGFGKTTLAEAICNDSSLQDHFHNQILWMSFGEEPDVLQIANTQIRLVTGNDSVQINLETAIRQLHDVLKGRRFLLVLDDVWQYAHIRDLIQKPHGWPEEAWQLRFLITTRQKDVITGAGIKSPIIVEQLTYQEAYALLVTEISDADTAQAELQALAARFKGWALPLELTNRQLRLHINRGTLLKQAITNINTDLDDLGFEGFDIRNSEQRNDAVGKSLNISLKLLADSTERFTELGIFPEDTAIPVSTLI